MKNIFYGIIIISIFALSSGCSTTPLIHQAITKGDLNATRELLDKGANINEVHKSCFWKTNSGTFAYPCTPLMHAAANGHNEIIKVLLDKGADINAKESDYTPLSWAASYGKIETAKLLFDKGADISGALAHAEYAGYADMVKLLIDRGADVNAKGRNWTAAPVLSEAAMAGHIDIIKLLINRGADLDAALAYLEGAAISYSQAEYKTGLKLLEKYAKKQEIATQPKTPASLTKEDMEKIVQTAVDKASKSKDKETKISSVQSDIDKPSFSPVEKIMGDNDMAVIIGIEGYQHLAKSDYSYDDAKLVKEYAKALGFKERNIELILDEKATKTTLEKTLEVWLKNKAKPDSRIFVYYSGHGAPDPATGEAYIVPFDGDPNYLAVTGYSLKRLYDSLGKLSANEVIVALDACFSGTGGRSVLAKGARPLVMSTGAMPISSNMAVLTATQGTQISTSSTERGHGIFTYFFLKAIKEGKKNIAEIYEYIKPLVEDEAKAINVQQSPSINPDVEKLRGKFELRK